MGAAFSIGRSALAAYQSALAITGQNIANVGNADYTRQTGHLTARRGGPTLDGVRPGGGVRLAELQRHIDEALEGRLRMANGARSRAESIYQALAQTEAQYNELTEHDLSSMLASFFGQFAALAGSPGDTSARNLVISTADGVINTMHRQRAGLLQQVSDLNDQVAAAASRANQLAAEVADLNEAIVQQESDGKTIASPLRDRRDAVLRKLGELLDLTVREQPNGAVNVYVGSEPLVDFGRSRGLETRNETLNGLEVAVVRYADNGGRVVSHGGRIAGLIEARDVKVMGQFERLDRLARGLIYEVNRQHANGVGLVGYTAEIGSFASADPTAALNSRAADLTYPVQNGTFLVRVRDKSSGQIVTRQIEVDLDGIGSDTSLNTLAADLNTVPGLSAGVTADGRLQLTADPNQEFWFNDDTSGALAALGVGNLLTGEDAGTIDLDAAVRADPRLVASAVDGEVNDGRIAEALARLADPAAVSTLLDNQSISNFHTTTVNRLAVDVGEAATTYEASDAIFAGLTAQREAISGVSLDEEAINLTKFERAFQGASRYIGVLETMTDELLTILR